MLSYLVDLVVDVQERLQASERTFLFLDFDGTLAPLRPRPDEARLPPLARL